MKKYLSFFRMRFLMGMQYRTAAAAGVATQFAWGFLEIMVYRAFYRADAAAFPMAFEAVVSYIWLQQAFLALFRSWIMENEIFSSISDGRIAYELCRPIRIYDMWFARSIANRISMAVLRCLPILLVAFFLPAPFRLTLPKNPETLLLFLVTMSLGLFVTVSMDVLAYLGSCHTISVQGIRVFYSSASELLCGQIIPIPFMPKAIGSVLECLPFAAVQNVPLRVYSGDLSGRALQQGILLQIFWIIVLVLGGKWIARHAERKIVLQGG